MLSGLVKITIFFDLAIILFANQMRDRLLKAPDDFKYR
ncbi:hypothetical protein Calab_1172 [Caldithrix abyssi DSM 13497]|uniref:Uncharacterized protein n=1 Tax=Caldithrix abyssi DSM 13497 TaxID=880073 RepID=H1XX61_CALAY|nr:hypothetical protein Cabys_3958 [Caldithrix abyssi DSM 13497]EHO40798.1 hypothetical protein Calab_1172 [Caldithrix abyssi DSM 13497]